MLLVVLSLALGGLLLAWTPEAASQEAAPGATTFPSAVYRFAGGSYDDLTGPATNAAENDVAVHPNVDTLLYIGFERPFDQASLKIGTGRDGGAVVWEYRAGTQGVWVELVPSDASEGVSRSGTHTVAWNPPPFWTRTELDADNAPGSFYYIRLRVTQRLDGAARLSQVHLEVWEEAKAVWSYAQREWTAHPALATADLLDVSVRPGLAVAVAGDGAVLRSVDGGEKWARVAKLEGDLRGVDFVDGLRGIIVGTNGDAWRSLDGGLTWSSVNTQVTNVLERVDWVEEGFIVAVGDGAVLRSTDGGTTWFKDWPTEHFFGVHFSDRLFGWIVGDAINREAVYTTRDGGVTWTAIDIPYPGVQFAKAVYFVDHDYGWIVGDGFKVRTMDRGATWDLWFDARPLKDVAFFDRANGWLIGDNRIQRIRRADEAAALVDFPSQYESGLHYPKALGIRSGQIALVVGSGGLILRTTTAGAQWTQPGERPAVELRALDRLPSGTVWAVGASGTILRSPDGGRNWTGLPEPPNTGLLYDVSFVDDLNGWIVGEGGLIHRTRDGGLTWTAQTSNTVSALYGIDMVSETVGWVVGDLGKVLRTTTGGDEWIAVDAPNPIPLRDVDRVGTRTFAAGAGTVLRRDDGQATWEPLTVPTATDIQSAQFATELRGWVVDANGRLYFTANGGVTWARQPVSPALPLFALHVASSEVVWAGGENGNLFRTNDAGDHWQLMPSGTTNRIYAISAEADGYGVGVGALGTMISTNGVWRDATQTNDVGYPHVPVAPSMSVGDQVFIGHDDVYDSVVIVVDMTADNGDVVWEYPGAGGWKTLPLQDGTHAFTYHGIGVLKFPIPTDWATRGIYNDTTPRYWIRARVTDAPSNSVGFLNEMGTLRLLQPVSGPSPSPSGSTSPSGSSSPTQRMDFGMTASPTAIDFGLRARQATASANLYLVAYRGTANAVLTIRGDAADWLQASASTFELRQGVNQTVRLDLRVPADAPPGPASARIYVDANPINAFGTVTGWIDVFLVVAAADLADVSYHTGPPRWTARFSNYLPGDADVRFEALLRPAGGSWTGAGGIEMKVPYATNRTVERDLDTAGLAAGAYDLRVSADLNGTERFRELRIFLGPSPVAVEDLLVEAAPFEDVTFLFRLRNSAPVALVARPVVTVYDADDQEVGRIQGASVTLNAQEAHDVSVVWEPVFGVFRASVQANVDNAEPSTALDQPFVVRGAAGPGPSVWERHLPLFLVVFVLVANVAAGVGLWTGRRS